MYGVGIEPVFLLGDWSKPITEMPVVVSDRQQHQRAYALVNMTLGEFLTPAAHDGMYRYFRLSSTRQTIGCN
jgi:hypothetical protein